jgi:hypothetical protein
MSSLLLLLVALALIVYMVVRQFRERQISFPSIFILPALLAYFSYTTIAADLAKNIVLPMAFIAALLVGAIAGLLLGYIRGSLARIRFDAQTGQIFAKGTTLSLVIWGILLIAKIAMGVLTYAGHPSAPLMLCSAFVSTFFLGNIVAEAACLLLRSARSQSQPISQSLR